MSRPLLCCLLALVATSAFAQAPAKSPVAPADRLFQAWDTNHDRALSDAEFRVGYAALEQALQAERRLRAQFRVVDTDHSGALEAGEFANLVLVKQAGAAAPPFARFDASGDAKLDFAEYVALVQALAPRPEVR